MESAICMNTHRWCSDAKVLKNFYSTTYTVILDFNFSLDIQDNICQFKISHLKQQINAEEFVLFCLIKNSFCCITSFWLLRIIKISCKKSWLNFVSLSIIIVASGISCMTTKLHWKENNNHWANSCGLNFFCAWHQV